VRTLTKISWKKGIDETAVLQFAKGFPVYRSLNINLKTS